MIVSKENPFAVRRIEFDEKDFRENPSILLGKNMLSKIERLKLAEKALVLIEGNDILQYGYEYPIVKYEPCIDLIQSSENYKLNSFVKSVTVSTVTNGKRFSIATGILDEKGLKNDTIVYFEDTKGLFHSVTQSDIFNFLAKKPYLIVSPEGVLVFYTTKSILCILDFNHCLHIDINKINSGFAKISGVEFLGESLEVILENGSNQIAYKLVFKVDCLGSNPIIPEFEEIK